MEENLRALDARIKELTEALAKTKIGSQEYADIVKDLVELNKVRESYVKAEQQRTDSNAKNDIAEAELVVKQQEAKNNKARNIVTVLTTLMTVVGYSATSIYQGNKAYEAEKTQIGNKGWLRRSDQTQSRMPK